MVAKETRDHRFTGMQVANPDTPDGLSDRPKHGPFVIPEEIGRAEDDAGDRDAAVEPMGLKGSQEDQKFADKPVGARQAD